MGYGVFSLTSNGSANGLRNPEVLVAVPPSQAASSRGWPWEPGLHRRGGGSGQHSHSGKLKRV